MRRKYLRQRTRLARGSIRYPQVGVARASDVHSGKILFVELTICMSGLSTAVCGAAGREWPDIALGRPMQNGCVEWPHRETWAFRE